MPRFVFRFVFPQVCIFNNFPASFLGSFRFVFGGRSFVFSNFLGSFFKITSFLSHNFDSKPVVYICQQLKAILKVWPDLLIPPPLCPGTRDWAAILK